MAGDSFGKLFKITGFGESHGPSIGGVIHGCPSGLRLDVEEIRREVKRRRPGQSSIVTQRKEEDYVEILSGVFQGCTTGAPIGFVVKNKDYISDDYDHIKDVYRPSHSDFTYDKKYAIRDHKGGGSSSARSTLCWVVAGAVAKQLVKEIKITAYVSSIEDLKLEKSYQELDLSEIENTPVRCPDRALAREMIELIKQVKTQGDTLGGVITCVLQNMPIGLGEPVFSKLSAELAKAMLSINSVKGFEYGSGFEGAKMRGSAHNDLFNEDGSTQSNYSGGIQGGISNGMDVYFKVAFKPVSTLMIDQTSIDKQGNKKVFQGKGRHDPCVLPRAVPIVEAMAALVLADHWLLNKTSRVSST